jgi:hypothetical protein
LLHALAHLFVELIASISACSMAREIVEVLLALGHLVPHVALEAALQQVVGERAEQILHAHFAGGIGNVFGVANAFHKLLVGFVVGRWLGPLVLAKDQDRRRTTLIKLPSLPVRPFFWIETPSRARFGLFFSGFEHAFFVAADALVRVQAFEDEFGSGDLLLGTFFLRDAQRAEFVDQALNAFRFSALRRREIESDN